MISEDTIQDLWSGSVPALSQIPGKAVTAVDNGIPVIIALLALLALILLHRHVLQAISGSMLIMTSGVRRKSVFSDLGYRSSALMAAVTLIPLYAYVLARCGASHLSFFATLGLTVAYLAYHPVAIYLSGSLHRISGTRDIIFLHRAASIMMMILSLPALLLAWIFPSAIPTLPGIWLALAAGVCLIPYWVTAGKMKESLGFSKVFIFLYLCALECLPLAVILKIFLS